MTLALVHEYRFLQSCSQDLIKIKKEYEEYVLNYKRIMDGYCTVKEEKKKSVTVEKETKETSFSIVNRDADYLMQSAVEFGRQHNLEDSMRRLYTMQPVSTTSSTRRYARKPLARTSRKRGPQRMPLSAAQLYMQKGDVIFNWPIEKKQFWISSKFGWRKVGNSWKFHYGTDLAAPEGTPVYPAASGIVTEITYSKKGYGKTVVIAHKDNYKSRYAHLKDIYVNNVGQTVNEAQMVGRVGSTGNVRGKNGRGSASHLHLEIIKLGKRINPQLVLL